MGFGHGGNAGYHTGYGDSSSFHAAERDTKINAKYKGGERVDYLFIFIVNKIAIFIIIFKLNYVIKPRASCSN